MVERAVFGGVAITEGETPKLTRKQQRFVNEYLVDYNATQAAIRSGYSKRSAYSIGQENLRKPVISAAIQENEMPPDETLLRLSDIARGDMGDFLDISSMAFQVDLAKALRLGKTKLIQKVKMRTTTTLSKDGVETETHDIEISLYSALDALDKIGKHHKLFTERQELTGPGGGPIETSITVKAVDYRTIATTLAPGSIPDSDTPGEGQGFSDGPEMG